MVMGNYLALRGDHNAALACFERAIRADPSRPYAFTLAGHEYTDLGLHTPS